jgi:hypothetical protein
MNFLTYAQARTIIEDGDIVFFHPKLNHDPLDAMIMFSTGSPFVHVNIAFWAEIGGQKRLMAVEAQGGTTRRIVNMSFYSDKDIVVIKGIKSWDDICADALSQVADQKYSYLTAFYAGLRDFSIQHLGIRLPKMNHPGEICSEFAARMCGFSGLFSPGDLYKTLLGMSVQKTV